MPSFALAILGLISCGTSQDTIDISGELSVGDLHRVETQCLAQVHDSFLLQITGGVVTHSKHPDGYDYPTNHRAPLKRTFRTDNLLGRGSFEFPGRDYFVTIHSCS